MVLFLNTNRLENNKFTENDFNLAESELIKSLECLDLINPKISDEDLINNELEKISLNISSDDTGEVELYIYNNFDYLNSLSTKELDDIYFVLARQNLAGDALQMRKNIEVIMDKRIQAQQYFEYVGN
jgi:hypothetical protein